MSQKSKINYCVGDSDTRPWGSWEVVSVGDGYAVKKIIVREGQLLSLQRHQYRAEHWIIVGGKASVTLNDDTFDLEVGQSVHIPEKTVHRIANFGNQDLCFIEVQIGNTLDEDDIERLEDSYGRVDKKGDGGVRRN